MSIVTDFEFNDQKHYLGSLCKREHDYRGTGQSLKFKSNDQCWHCKKEYMTKYDRSQVPERAKERQAKLDSVKVQIVDTEKYNEKKHQLGKLCDRKHDFRGTGQSLRYINHGTCFFCNAENDKIHYAVNREARLAQRRKFKEENREQVLEKRRQYKKENREMFRELNQKYRNTENGKKVMQAAFKKYAQSEKGKLKARMAAHKRRALIRSSQHEPYSKLDIQNLLGKFENACAYCGKHQSELEQVLELEHVVALSKGGADRIQNIVPACCKCNNSKRARMLADWYLKQNFATLDKLLEIALHLGDEEIEHSGLSNLEIVANFFAEN